MEADEKKCPRCAEIVKAEARVCKHCGYDFETGASPGTITEPVPPQKKSKTAGCLMIGGGVLLVLILLAIFAPSPEESGTAGVGTEAATTAADDPPMQVTAEELFAAYDSNEAAAQQRYGGSRLQVSGTVAGVQLDFMDEPVVLLQTQNQFMSAQAQLTEESKPMASGLSKGQQVVLICAGVSEVIGTPMLSDCSIQ